MTGHASGPKATPLSVRARMRSSPRPSFVAKDGEQLMEMRSSERRVFAWTSEQNFWCEAFRKLGFRICAPEEEAKITPIRSEWLLCRGLQSFPRRLL
jgi:hypothetical protein